MYEGYYSERTKDRTSDAALEMFSQNGYSGTKIRELSASLGLVNELFALPYELLQKYRII
ncbi:MAG: TetR family transcriptional regulator [Clostridia bacterium]|nr:TetR family transcriptional regulator [Clostridia bacterium]